MSSNCKYRLTWTACNGKSKTKAFDSQAESFAFIKTQKHLSSKDFRLCTITKET